MSYNKKNMKPIAAIGGGLAGACTITLIHETMKRIVPEAPRMDLLGMNAISKGMHAAGANIPSNKKLFAWSLAGDLVSNSIYYSLAGIGKEKNVWLRSSLLGLAAGISAVTLPSQMGLNGKHTNKRLSTKVLTVGLYVAGALITTGVMKLLEHRKQKKDKVWEQRLVTSAMG
jgi:hypothetical protein